MTRLPGETLGAVHQSIEVEAPVATAYETWSDFANFPRFMSHVKSVEVRGDDSDWVSEIMGVRAEWQARTISREPDRLIAWKAVGDAGMDGTITFTPLSEWRTRVEVDFEWKGRGIKAGAAEVLSLEEGAVKEDLRKFKEHVEAEARRAPVPRR